MLGNNDGVCLVFSLEQASLFERADSVRTDQNIIVGRALPLGHSTRGDETAGEAT